MMDTKYELRRKVSNYINFIRGSLNLNFYEAGIAIR
jgi:hypothetical protein